MNANITLNVNLFLSQHLDRRRCYGSIRHRSDPNAPLINALGNKLTVASPGRTNRFAKIGQHGFYILPRLNAFAHEHPMTAKWIVPQRIHIRNQFGSQRIQMDVPHQFKQIGIFLAQDQDRFVPILKQVPMASMTAVEAYGMAGQQSPHHGGDWGITRP